MGCGGLKGRQEDPTRLGRTNPRRRVGDNTGAWGGDGSAGPEPAFHHHGHGGSGWHDQSGRDEQLPRAGDRPRHDLQAGQGNGPADCGRRPGDEAAEEDAYCKNSHLTSLFSHQALPAHELGSHHETGRPIPTNPRPVRSATNVGSKLAGISSFPPMALRPTIAGDENGGRLRKSLLVIRPRRRSRQPIACSVSFRSTRTAIPRPREWTIKKISTRNPFSSTDRMLSLFSVYESGDENGGRLRESHTFCKAFTGLSS